MLINPLITTYLKVRHFFESGSVRSRADATLLKWTSTRPSQKANAELQRHTWGTFVDKGVSVALGGNGIVVPGCEACRKRINTNGQYLRHLAEDVLPGILESASGHK